MHVSHQVWLIANWRYHSCRSELEGALKCGNCNWSKNWCQSRGEKIQNQIFFCRPYLCFCLLFFGQNISCCLLFGKAFVVQVFHYNERKLPQNQMKQCAGDTHTKSSIQISETKTLKIVFFTDFYLIWTKSSIQISQKKF